MFTFGTEAVRNINRSGALTLQANSVSNATQTELSYLKNSVDVTNDVLEKIKCSQCEGVLSFGPVYIKENGKVVCRKCKHPKESLPRNTQYEALASLVKFPCKYQDLGCKEMIPFYEGLPPAHEVACDYKQYLCPVMESGRCNWLGRRCEILKHCQDEHQESVLTNPCTLTHDISRFSMNTYLLQAFEFLFLLHTKVCVTSNKIFHSVRVLGDPDLTKKFKYKLEIKNGELTQSKPGRVAPEGCRAIQEDSSITTGINSLLEFLDGYDGTIFIITIQSLVDLVKCVTEGCASASASASVLFSNSDNVNNCMALRRYCKNKSQGCQYNDINEKCEKHETYFCYYIKICPLCNRSLNQGVTLDKHYESTHLHLETIHINYPVNYSSSNYTGQTYVLRSNVGIVILFCKFNSLHELTVNIFSSLRSENLREYNCKIQVNRGGNSYYNLPNNTITSSPQPVLEKFDWTDDIKVQNLVSGDGTFIILSINISKYILTPVLHDPISNQIQNQMDYLRYSMGMLRNHQSQRREYDKKESNASLWGKMNL